ncbi:MAG TPA: Ig-like domain-containing protein, partial [Thermoanaerobaculia bacterium]
SATSPFKDNIYVIWHPGLPAVVARRTGPTGSWQAAVQVSGAETTGTAIGDDIKTNSFGDVFGFFPDTGSRRFNVVKSTNGGVSFGTPVRIATGFGSFQYAIPADASRQPLIYISGGAYRTSTKNNVYAAWNDLSGDTGCTSGAGPGTNAASTCKSRIFFARSTDGGATWSAPVKINNQSGLNDQFNQWLVVDETNGKIALMYYDTVGDSTRKSVNVYYQSSTDDGVTWSAPFKVTTATTNETTAGADSGNQFGDYTNLDGINGTFFPSWTDRRSGASEEIWTAAIADGTTPNPDFAMSASPTSVSIAPGNFSSSTITTTISGAFANAVALSATGQPTGVTVGFSPTSIPVPGSGSSTMTITVGSSVTPGTYAITVTGTGGISNHTTTVNLTVSTTADTTPPTTSITAPLNGATVSGMVNVAASAADNVGVTKVELYIDGTLKSTVTTSPYSFSWDTTTVANGSHTIVSKAYDAANNIGTSATVTVTVSNTTTVQQLLGNPGFENGSSSPAPWTVTAGVIDSSTGEAAHSGTWKAWLDGYGTTHTDSILQTVTIPSTATTATLTFWLHIDTAETTTTTAFDTLKVQIRNSSGTVLATLATYSNLNKATGFSQKSFNLIAYKGQTIQVFLVGAEDSSLQTSFVVDDFALNVQ